MNFRSVQLSPAFAAVAAALHARSGLPEQWTEHAFVELLGMNAVAGRVLMAADEPIGLILWRRAADEGEVLTICVAPGQRRHGAGRLLMEGAIAAMANDGVRRLCLEVAEDNGPALALYRSFGFSAAGRRPAYYPTAGGAADALIMAKDLP